MAFHLAFFAKRRRRRTKAQRLLFQMALDNRPQYFAAKHELARRLAVPERHEIHDILRYDE